MHMYMPMAMLMLTTMPRSTGDPMVFTSLPHRTLTAAILRWVVEPRTRLYTSQKYSPPIARSPLPCWQVRVAFRRASRRAIQTRQSLSLPPNTPHPLRPVQHAARVSARHDLPRSPAIYYIYITTAATVLYCLGKRRRSNPTGLVNWV
jgi:hypothetical protein